MSSKLQTINAIKNAIYSFSYFVLVVAFILFPERFDGWIFTFTDGGVEFNLRVGWHYAIIFNCFVWEFSEP